MLIAGFPAGPWGTNCYVLATGPGAECLIIDPGQDRVWGGYSGYFQDLDAHLWEVVWNPDLASIG